MLGMTWVGLMECLSFSTVHMKMWLRLWTLVSESLLGVSWVHLHDLMDNIFYFTCAYLPQA